MSSEKPVMTDSPTILSDCGNGTSVQQGPPSPLSGGYLLVIISEPHNEEDKKAILQKLNKGFLSWDISESTIDIEKELAVLSALEIEGDLSANGERVIQNASDDLITEILIHPQVTTVRQCIRNLLSSFTKYRYILHAGYTFSGNGSWMLQDGTYSISDLIEDFQEPEVKKVIKAYDKAIKTDICCLSEGSWKTARINQEKFAKRCKVEINPTDRIIDGNVAIREFIEYLEKLILPQSVEQLLQPSDVVGNIRFTNPTLYVFPGGDGDSALFGINGFNMLVDGGSTRKACSWNFVRHLDRLDAVLMTRLNNTNVAGLSAILQRKVTSPVFPHIGHFFGNMQIRRSLPSPDGDKEKDPLLIHLADQSDAIISNLKQLQLKPQQCYRESVTQPINLYHKVGHGKLDMYVISPGRDSREVKDFLARWNNNDPNLFSGYSKATGRELRVPLQNFVSICALLVWTPENPNGNITRILLPGSAPQYKIFEGLSRIKQPEFLKYPTCTTKSLAATSVASVRQPVKQKVFQPVEKVDICDISKGQLKSTVPGDVTDGEVSSVAPATADRPKLNGITKVQSESEKSQSKDEKKLDITGKPKVNGLTKVHTESEKLKSKEEKKSEPKKKTVVEVQKPKTETKSEPETVKRAESSLDKKYTVKKAEKQTEKKVDKTSEKLNGYGKPQEGIKPATKAKTRVTTSQRVPSAKAEESIKTSTASITSAETTTTTSTPKITTKATSKLKSNQTVSIPKSLKEANNRKVAEAKINQKPLPTPAVDTKPTKKESIKIEKKPTSKQEPSKSVPAKPKPIQPPKKLDTGIKKKAINGVKVSPSSTPTTDKSIIITKGKKLPATTLDKDNKLKELENGFVIEKPAIYNIMRKAGENEDDEVLIIEKTVLESPKVETSNEKLYKYQADEIETEKEKFADKDTGKEDLDNKKSTVQSLEEENVASTEKTSKGGDEVELIIDRVIDKDDKSLQGDLYLSKDSEKVNIESPSATGISSTKQIGTDEAASEESVLETKSVVKDDSQKLEETIEEAENSLKNLSTEDTEKDDSGKLKTPIDIDSHKTPDSIKESFITLKPLNLSKYRKEDTAVDSGVLQYDGSDAFKRMSTPDIKDQLEIKDKSSSTPEIKSKEGIKEISPKTPEIKSQEEVKVKSPTTPGMKSQEEVKVKSPTTPEMKSQEEVKVKSPTTPEIKSQEEIKEKSPTTPEIKSQEGIKEKSPTTPEIKSQEEVKVKSPTTPEIKSQEEIKKSSTTQETKSQEEVKGKSPTTPEMKSQEDVKGKSSTTPDMKSQVEIKVKSPSIPDVYKVDSTEIEKRIEGMFSDDVTIKLSDERITPDLKTVENITSDVEKIKKPEMDTAVGSEHKEKIDEEKKLPDSELSDLKPVIIDKSSAKNDDIDVTKDAFKEKLEVRTPKDIIGSEHLFLEKKEEEIIKDKGVDEKRISIQLEDKLVLGTSGILDNNITLVKDGSIDKLIPSETTIDQEYIGKDSTKELRKKEGDLGEILKREQSRKSGIMIEKEEEGGEHDKEKIEDDGMVNKQEKDQTTEAQILEEKKVESILEVAKEDTKERKVIKEEAPEVENLKQGDQVKKEERDIEKSIVDNVVIEQKWRSGRVAEGKNIDTQNFEKVKAKDEKIVDETVTKYDNTTADIKDKIDTEKTEQDKGKNDEEKLVVEQKELKKIGKIGKDEIFTGDAEDAIGNAKKITGESEHDKNLSKEDKVGETLVKKEDKLQAPVMHEKKEEKYHDEVATITKEKTAKEKPNYIEDRDSAIKDTAATENATEDKQHDLLAVMEKNDEIAPNKEKLTGDLSELKADTKNELGEMGSSEVELTVQHLQKDVQHEDDHKDIITVPHEDEKLDKEKHVIHPDTKEGKVLETESVELERSIKDEHEVEDKHIGMMDKEGKKNLENQTIKEKTEDINTVTTGKEKIKDMDVAKIMKEKVFGVEHDDTKIIEEKKETEIEVDGQKDTDKVKTTEEKVTEVEHENPIVMDKRKDIDIVSSELDKKKDIDIVSPELDKKKDIGIVSPEFDKKKDIDVVCTKLDKKKDIDVGSPELDKKKDIDIVSPELDKKKDIDVVSPELDKKKDIDTVSPELDKKKDNDIVSPEFDKKKDIDVVCTKLDKKKDIDVGSPELDKKKEIDVVSHELDKKKDIDVVSPEFDKKKNIDTVSHELDKKKDIDVASSELDKKKDMDVVSPEFDKKKDIDVVSPEFDKKKNIDTVSPELDKKKDIDVVSPEFDKKKDIDVVSPEFDKKKDVDIVSPELDKKKDIGIVSPEFDKKKDIDVVSPELDKKKDIDVVSPELDKKKDIDIVSPEFDKKKDIDVASFELHKKKDIDVVCTKLDKKKDIDTVSPELDKKKDIDVVSPEFDKKKDIDIISPELDKKKDIDVVSPEFDKKKDIDVASFELHKKKDIDVVCTKLDKKKDIDTVSPELDKKKDIDVVSPEFDKKKDIDIISPELDKKKDIDVVSPEFDKKKDVDIVSPELDKKKGIDVVSPEFDKKKDIDIISPELDKKKDIDVVSPEFDKKKDVDIVSPELDKKKDIGIVSPEFDKKKDIDVVSPELDKKKDIDVVSPELDKKKDIDIVSPEFDKKKDIDVASFELHKKKDIDVVCTKLDKKKDIDTVSPELDKKKDIDVVSPEFDKKKDIDVASFELHKKKDIDVVCTKLDKKKDIDTVSPELDKKKDIDVVSPEFDKKKDIDIISPELDKKKDIDVVSPEFDKKKDVDIVSPELDKKKDIGIVSPEFDKKKDIDVVSPELDKKKDIDVVSPELDKKKDIDIVSPEFDKKKDIDVASFELHKKKDIDVASFELHKKKDIDVVCTKLDKKKDIDTVSPELDKKKDIDVVSPEFDKKKDIDVVSPELDIKKDIDVVSPELDKKKDIDIVSPEFDKKKDIDVASFELHKKKDIDVVCTKLDKKKDIDTVSPELDKKKDIGIVSSEFDKKKDIDVVSPKLDKKKDIDIVSPELDKKKDNDVVSPEFDKKKDIDIVSTELDKKKDIGIVCSEFDKKKDIDVVSPELDKKKDIDILSPELDKKKDNDVVSPEFDKKKDIDIVSTEFDKKKDIDIVCTKLDKKKDIDVASPELHKKKEIDVISPELDKKKDIDIVSPEFDKKKDIDVASFELHKKKDIDVVCTKLDKKKDIDTVSPELDKKKDIDVVSPEFDKKKDIDVASFELHKKKDIDVVCTKLDKKKDIDMVTTEEGKKKETEKESTVEEKAREDEEEKEETEGNKKIEEKLIGKLDKEEKLESEKIIKESTLEKYGGAGEKENIIEAVATEVEESKKYAEIDLSGQEEVKFSEKLKLKDELPVKAVVQEKDIIMEEGILEDKINGIKDNESIKEKRTAADKPDDQGEKEVFDDVAILKDLEEEKKHADEQKVHDKKDSLSTDVTERRISMQAEEPKGFEVGLKIEESAKSGYFDMQSKEKKSDIEKGGTKGEEVAEDKRIDIKDKGEEKVPKEIGKEDMTEEKGIDKENVDAKKDNKDDWEKSTQDKQSDMTNTEEKDAKTKIEQEAEDKYADLHNQDKTMSKEEKEVPQKEVDTIGKLDDRKDLQKEESEVVSKKVVHKLETGVKVSETEAKKSTENEKGYSQEKVEKTDSKEVSVTQEKSAKGEVTDKENLGDNLIHKYEENQLIKREEHTEETIKLSSSDKHESIQLKGRKDSVKPEIEIGGDMDAEKLQTNVDGSSEMSTIHGENRTAEKYEEKEGVKEAHIKTEKSIDDQDDICTKIEKETTSPEKEIIKEEKREDVMKVEIITGGELISTLDKEVKRISDPVFDSVEKTVGKDIVEKKDTEEEKKDPEKETTKKDQSTDETQVDTQGRVDEGKHIVLLDKEENATRDTHIDMKDKEEITEFEEVKEKDSVKGDMKESEDEGILGTKHIALDINVCKEVKGRSKDSKDVSTGGKITDKERFETEDKCIETVSDKDEEKIPLHLDMKIEEKKDSHEEVSTKAEKYEVEKHSDKGEIKEKETVKEKLDIMEKQDSEKIKEEKIFGGKNLDEKDVEKEEIKKVLSPTEHGSETTKSNDSDSQTPFPKKSVETLKDGGEDFTGRKESMFHTEEVLEGLKSSIVETENFAKSDETTSKHASLHTFEDLKGTEGKGTLYKEDDGLSASPIVQSLINVAPTVSGGTSEHITGEFIESKDTVMTQKAVSMEPTILQEDKIEKSLYEQDSQSSSIAFGKEVTSDPKEGKDILKVSPTATEITSKVQETAELRVGDCKGELIITQASEQEPEKRTEHDILFMPLSGPKDIKEGLLQGISKSSDEQKKSTQKVEPEICGIGIQNAQTSEQKKTASGDLPTLTGMVQQEVKRLHLSALEATNVPKLTETGGKLDVTPVESTQEKLETMKHEMVFTKAPFEEEKLRVDDNLKTKDGSTKSQPDVGKDLNQIILSPEDKINLFGEIDEIIATAKLIVEHDKEYQDDSESTGISGKSTKGSIEYDVRLSEDDKGLEYDLERAEFLRNVQMQEQLLADKASTTADSGATTASTLPEDERVDVSSRDRREFTDGSVGKEGTGSQVEGIKGTSFLGKVTASHDLKTPDEVAELPNFEVCEIDTDIVHPKELKDDKNIVSSSSKEFAHPERYTSVAEYAEPIELIPSSSSSDESSSSENIADAGFGEPITSKKKKIEIGVSSVNTKNVDASNEYEEVRHKMEFDRSPPRKMEGYLFGQSKVTRETTGTTEKTNDKDSVESKTTEKTKELEVHTSDKIDKEDTICDQTILGSNLTQFSIDKGTTSHTSKAGSIKEEQLFPKTVYEKYKQEEDDDKLSIQEFFQKVDSLPSVVTSSIINDQKVGSVDHSEQFTHSGSSDSIQEAKDHAELFIKTVPEVLSSQDLKDKITAVGSAKFPSEVVSIGMDNKDKVLPGSTQSQGTLILKDTTTKVVGDLEEKVKEDLVRAEKSSSKTLEEIKSSTTGILGSIEDHGSNIGYEEIITQDSELSKIESGAPKSGDSTVSEVILQKPEEFAKKSVKHATSLTQEISESKDSAFKCEKDVPHKHLSRSVSEDVSKLNFGISKPVKVERTFRQSFDLDETDKDEELSSSFVKYEQSSLPTMKENESVALHKKSCQSENVVPKPGEIYQPIELRKLEDKKEESDVTNDTKDCSSKVEVQKTDIKHQRRDSVHVSNGVMQELLQESQTKSPLESKLSLPVDLSGIKQTDFGTHGKKEIENVQTRKDFDSIIGTSAEAKQSAKEDEEHKRTHTMADLVPGEKEGYLHLSPTQQYVRFTSEPVKKSDDETIRIHTMPKSKSEEIYDTHSRGECAIPDIVEHEQKKKSVSKTISLPILDETLESSTKHVDKSGIDKCDELSRSLPVLEKIEDSRKEMHHSQLSDPAISSTKVELSEAKSASLPVIEKLHETEKYMTLPHLYKAVNLEDLSGTKETDLEPSIQIGMVSKDMSIKIRDKLEQIEEPHTSEIVTAISSKIFGSIVHERIDEVPEDIRSEGTDKSECSYSENSCFEFVSPPSEDSDKKGPIIKEKTGVLVAGLREEAIEMLKSETSSVVDHDSDCDRPLTPQSEHSAEHISKNTSQLSGDRDSDIDESDYEIVEMSSTTTVEEIHPITGGSVYETQPSIILVHEEEETQVEKQDVQTLLKDMGKPENKGEESIETSDTENKQLKEKDDTSKHDGSTSVQATPKEDPIKDWGKPLGLPKPTELGKALTWNPLEHWGIPLELPSPVAIRADTNGDQDTGTSAEDKGTPKKIGKKSAETNGQAVHTTARDHSRTRDSPVKRSITPGSKMPVVYVDLAYVPHHGNPNYTTIDFFKKVRARYYVFSGTNPSKEVFNALMEAKKTWENQNLEVTIIPTYDTDSLGYWLNENEHMLANLKIDLLPSASRCTINLQDHDTSCSAYRLEF